MTSTQAQGLFRRLSGGFLLYMDDKRLNDMDKYLDEPEATHFAHYARSVPNPDQIGTLDKYIVSMTPFPA